jgi:hypothetical protein
MSLVDVLHKRKISQEGNSLAPHVPDPPPCSEVPPSKPVTQNSHLRGNGVGHNRSIGSSVWFNHKKKCWKVREGKPSFVLN